MVSPEDAEVNAAINQARQALPAFWSEFEHPRPNESDFGLKLEIRDGDQVEHFWMTNIERRAGRISGVVSNDPEFVHNVKLGDRLPIPEKDISDWEYTRDGKLVGAYTTRVLVKRAPNSDEVRHVKQMLGEP